METDELIDKLTNAQRLEQVMNVNNFKDEYRSLVKKLHPDMCKHPKAAELFDKLNQLKDKFENGVTFKDEAGKFNTKGMESRYTGDFNFLKASYGNYNKLMNFHDKASESFKRYIPKTMGISGTELLVKYHERAIPLSGLTLPQKHVNWIFSRMIEFAAWLQQQGLSHCGINPESMFITPENHGLQVSSFYMMTKLGQKPEGVAGMYINWYPPELFKDKKAITAIDVELCKKTAIYLLGDRSGVGIKLKRDPNIHQAVLDFLIARHDDAYQCFKEYRELLDKHFKKEFHILDL